MTRSACALIVLAVVLGTQACASPPVAPDAAFADVPTPDAPEANAPADAAADAEDRIVALSVSPATATMSPGSQLPFVANAAYASGRRVEAPAGVTWISSDTSIATIDTDGVATGVTPGDTTIVASLGAISAAPALLAIRSGEPEDELINLTPDVLEVRLSDTSSHPLGAYRTRSDGMTYTLNDEPGVTWTSSDTTVARVDARGFVTVGSRLGTAIIIVRQTFRRGFAMVTVTF